MSGIKTGDSVTTVEQLEALPAGSVIRTDMSVIAQKSWCNKNSPDDWNAIGTDEERLSSEITDFPMLVLWVGGGES